MLVWQINLCLKLWRKSHAVGRSIAVGIVRVVYKRQGAWSVDLTQTLVWVLAQARAEVDVSPSQSSSVLGWLLWKLSKTDLDRFVVLAWSDYGRRHGLTARSILWPSHIDRELRLRHQFIADMIRGEAKTTADSKA